MATDQQGARLAGVTITAASASTAGVARTVTDETGRYQIVNLEPGEYTISASLPGFATTVWRGMVLREGLNLTARFSLSVGALSDVVVVTADAPLIEWKSPTQTVNISGDLQRSLPLSSLRTWGDFLLLAPGIVTTQARFQSYFLHGTAGGSGAFLVDGADATSPLQGSTLYSQFAGDTFSDVQIKTAAIDAASPLGFGPVVNIATRSGTNVFRGSAALDYQPTRWNGANTPGGQNLTVTTRQYDGSLGGPIQRDRLWFFVSGRVARNRTGNPRSAQQLAFLRAVEPAFEPFDNTWKGDVLFAKGTVQIAPSHSLIGSFTHDVVHLGGAQPNEIAAFREIVIGGPGAFARLSSVWNGSLVSSLSIGYNGKRQQNRNLQPATTGIAVHQSVFPSGGRLIGTGAIAVREASPFAGIDFDTSMWTISADVAHTRTTRLGVHDIQAGAYLQPQRRNRWVSQYNNRGFQLEEVVLRNPADPAAGVVPFHRQIFDVGEIATRHVDSRDVAGYAQHVWRPATRLALTTGVRIDRVTRTDRIVDRVTQRSTEVGPRVGVVYQVSANERDALRASWSRVHDNLASNETTAGSSRAGVRNTYDPLLDGTFPVEFVTPAQTTPSLNVEIDLDGYHQPHFDEVIVGYRRQLPGRTSVDVSGMHRAYRARPALVETNAIYDGVVFAGYRDESRNEIYRLTSNSWNWPVVTAFQSTVVRQSATLQAIASYTRAWNRMAGTWQPRDPAAFIQPETFANRHGIGFISGCTADGLTCPDSNSLATGIGGGTWRDHVVNLGVAYNAPWQIHVAASYNIQSGPWSGPIQTLAAPDPRFGPPTVTLSNQRVVANPLATPVRFAYPTRGEGQLRLDALHLLNLRVTRRVPLGSRRLDLSVDVFNVTNGDTDQAFQSGAHQQFSPFFGQGSTRQFPRALKLGLYLQF